MTNRPACLANLSDVDIAVHRYARVTTPHFRSYRYVSVLVPDPLAVQLRDKVEISPPSCKDGATPEVVQVLKRSAQRN